MYTKPYVIIIIGPTAVGKTRLSIDLAKKIDGEIVSADSMQIYKYMNIGTAKPDADEMCGINHHLIDEIDPSVDFSVAQYKEFAEKYIDEIINKGKVPIIVGGTGLYINSLLYNIQFSEIVSDDEYRDYLYELAKEEGNEYIHEMLKSIDENSYKKLHPNDLKRVVRALEVYKCTGKTITYYQSVSRAVESRYNFIIIGLNMEREILYERINKRVDIMMEAGLVNEVMSLLEKGYTIDNISMQGIGYKEIIGYLNGEYSLEEAVEIIKRESRRYAKRQMTWFRRIDQIQWFNVDVQDYEKTFHNVYEYIAQNLEII